MNPNPQQGESLWNNPEEGWYYRLHDMTLGPVSTEVLRNLLAMGRILPRQAVWRQGKNTLIFVTAATAIGRPELLRSQAPVPRSS